MKNNMVGWFEIPVMDMARASKFYQEVFQIEFEKMAMNDMEMMIFPMVENVIGAGGALTYMPSMMKPSSDGTLIYFTAHSGDLNNELARIEPAGGKVLLPKTLIKEDIGYFAIFLDTEGNRLALHSHA